jgi:hypothetical protein
MLDALPITLNPTSSAEPEPLLAQAAFDLGVTGRQAGSRAEAAEQFQRSLVVG